MRLSMTQFMRFMAKVISLTFGLVAANERDPENHRERLHSNVPPDAYTIAIGVLNACAEDRISARKDGDESRGAGDGIRTRDNLLGKQELYH